MQNVRSKNNKYSMDMLRLAFKYAPNKASELMKKVNLNDQKSIIERFEHYNFPYELITYDKNRNFLNPKFYKTIMIDHSKNNPSFYKQIELIRKLA